jgi:choline dehydrogenase-like flavoprotein
MIIDARRVDGPFTLLADIVIVGGGVAGITMALELDRQGVDTILLESGGHEPDPATRDLQRGTSTAIPYRFADGCRSRFLGGSSNCWGGWCRPFDDWDFERRDWVAHSGWPIGAAEVEPYYRRTHAYLDLGPYNYDIATFVDAVDRPDVARLPLPTGRVVDSMSQFSRSTQLGKKYRAALEASRHVRTFLHANVVEIETDPAGCDVRRVRCRTLTGKSFDAVGRAFVIAAGGIENPRLLLASRGVWRHGLGNDNDLVGRFFMDHPRILSGSIRFRGRWAANKLFDAKFHDRNDAVMAWGTHVAGALGLTPEVQAREQVGNARVWFSSIFPGEHTCASDALIRIWHRRQQKVPPDARLSRDLVTLGSHPVDSAAYLLTRAYRRRALVRAVRFQAIVEVEPDPTARVTLSPRETDALGLPRVQVGWKLPQLVRRTFDRNFAIVADELQRAGVADVALDAPLEGGSEWPASLNPQGTWHHMGTTRMSGSPRTGVVDRDCRVFGLTNLYLAGSSVFPTSSANFPTQMICALAIRLAEHLVRRLDGRALPMPSALSGAAVRGR